MSWHVRGYQGLLLVLGKCLHVSSGDHEGECTDHDASFRYLFASTSDRPYDGIAGEFENGNFPIYDTLSTTRLFAFLFIFFFFFFYDTEPKR
jgi:hypothetical protein